MMRDIYITDMLRFAAFGMVKEEKRPKRYWDMIKLQIKPRAVDGTAREFSDGDVVDMFRGEGALV